MADELPRLRDDPSVSSMLREDLRRVEAIAPSPVNLEGGLERLRAQIGSPPASTSIPGQTAWWTGGIATIVVMGAAVLWSANPNHTAVPQSQPPKTTVVREQTPTTKTEPVVAAPEPTDFEQVSAERPEAARRAKPEDPDARLRRELAHMARLRTTLPDDPALALKLANEGQRAFRGGMFDQERSAIAILALDALGKHTLAQSRATNFLQLYPHGPFAARLRTILDTQAEGPRPQPTSNHQEKP